MYTTRSLSLEVVGDHRRLRDTIGGILGQRLDDERERQAGGTLDHTADREDGERRHRDAIVG